MPIDDGIISEKDMIRQLAEADMPHRINLDAVRAVYKALQRRELQFYQFSYALII